MMNFLMNFFRKNLSEKCLALIVAVGCWIFVMNDQNPPIENTYTVPVAVVNAPDGYQISKDVNEVRLKVRAQRSLFANVDASDFKVYIDLNNVESGTHELQVQAALPSGFDMVSVDPVKISVHVDKIENKQVPIRLKLSGAAGDGKVVGKVEQSLQNVTVEGPISALNQVTAVVGYIGLNGNTDDFNVTVPLVAVNDKEQLVEGVKLVPKTVDVNIKLARGLNTKIVDIKPTVMSDLPKDYILKSVKVDPEKIEISGSADSIGPLAYIATDNISLADMTKSSSFPVQLAVPDGVAVTNDTVTVYIDIEKKDDTAEKPKS